MAANTLAEKIADSRISFAALESDYQPMLRMVELLIGVVPNCDRYLEIWPTGFKSYNLLVANLLNIPFSLLGQGAPKDLVGLAMYSSSRAAHCMYCSAHTCSFALRRGVDPSSLTGTFSDPIESAVARMAEAMSSTPADLSAEDVRAVQVHLGETDTEWIALSVAMMGFLNKFMDTMGVELEQGAIDDVNELISPTGWSPGKHAWTAEDIDGELGQAGGQTLDAASRATDRPAYLDVPKDSLSTYLRALRQTPAALRLDRQWTRGKSGRAGNAIAQLETELGVAYGPLANVRQPRALKALSTTVLYNLDPTTTTLGLEAKILIGLVYAQVVGSEALLGNNVQLADKLAPSLTHRKMVAIRKFASEALSESALPAGLTSVEAAAVLLAKAAAPSPSEINSISIDFAFQSLTPPQIVEAVVWLSIQQTLHRLEVFYDASIELNRGPKGR